MRSRSFGLTREILREASWQKPKFQRCKEEQSLQTKEMLFVSVTWGLEGPVDTLLRYPPQRYDRAPMDSCPELRIPWSFSADACRHPDHFQFQQAYLRVQKAPTSMRSRLRVLLSPKKKAFLKASMCRIQLFTWPIASPVWRNNE